MRKISEIVFLFVAMFFLVIEVVQAAGLTLTKIGTFSTVGIDYSIVDYVGGIPLLEGTATPGAQVRIKIKTVVAYSTAASPSGVWQFVPTSLDAGTNDVLITSGQNTLSFVLNFNSVVAATPTATPTATIALAAIDNLPESGMWENVVMVIIVGIGVMFLGSYVKRRMSLWEGKSK